VIVYPFVGGIAERLRPGQRREAVLAWGIFEDGRKGSSGVDDRLERRRGDGKSLLPGSEHVGSAIRCSSHPTARRGLEECFPRSARQRSLAHRMREVAVKVPTDLLLSGTVAGDHAPTGDFIRADCADLLPSALACFEGASPTCSCQSPIAASFERRICSNDCSSTSVEG
jgi:hypothetical protein